MRRASMTIVLMVMACQVPTTAQQAVVPAEGAVQVDAEQKALVVPAFDGVAAIRTTGSAAEGAYGGREAGPPGERAWRFSVPHGEDVQWGNTDAAVGNRLDRGADGRLVSKNAAPPTVSNVFFGFGPQRGDTYAAGNRIEVLIAFDRDVTLWWDGDGPPPVTLALEIGARTRRATVHGCFNQRPGSSRCGGELGGIIFFYDIREGDHDPDGLSIPADALRLNGMRIQDSAGTDADLGLGSHAIRNDPAHKVDGGLDYAPMIRSMRFHGRPQHDDTYLRGERILVELWFDENVTVTGEPTLALTIGTRIREALSIGTGLFTKRLVFFEYWVHPDDRDTNGISIGADALRLDGGSIRDASGSDVPSDLSAVAITDDPRQKVDGTREFLPGIDRVHLNSRPKHGDTYGRGETIDVRIGFGDLVVFQWPNEGPLPLELTLQIGGEERQVAGVTVFRYDVQAADFDPDGISILPDALRHVAGTIRDGQGRDITDLTLGEHAVTNHPEHRVDGRELTAVGILPPLEFAAVGEVATVDVSEAFRGLVTSYSTMSSNPRVALAANTGALVTVSAIASGQATIEVIARNATVTAAQSFVVTVPFTDDPIMPGVTPIKAIHFMELRARIDELRDAAGLGRFAWTDRLLRSSSTQVKRVHLLELREALAAAYAAAGRTAPRWTDAAPWGRDTPIRAVHVMELRAATAALD